MTPHALRLLGLGTDADERAIKRAYAARLKTTRPDEDPEGFQRLNEAYAEALAWLRSRQDTNAANRADASADDVHASADAGSSDGHGRHGDGSHPRATAMLLPVAEEPPVDVATLFHALLEAASNASDEAFDAWLQAQPAFWSIADKAMLGRRLVALLRDEQPPIPESRFECLVSFFAWDDLSKGQDALMLDRLRRVLQAAWDVACESAEGGPIAIPVDADGWPRYGADTTAQAYAANLANRRERNIQTLIRTRHPELLGRRSWPKLLVAVLLPARTEAVRHVLSAAAVSGTLAMLDSRWVRFWQDTGDLSSPTRGSTMVVFTRSFAIGLAFALFVLGVADFYTHGRASFDSLIGGPIIAAAIATLTACGWLVMVLMVAFVRWQEGPDPAPGWRRRLHRLTVPALVAIGAALMASPLPDGIALPVLLGAAVTSWCRWMTRKPRLLPFRDRDADDARLLRQIVLAVLFALLLVRIATSPNALAWSCVGSMLVAAAFWTGDALRRHDVQPARTRSGS